MNQPASSPRDADANHSSAEGALSKRGASSKGNASGDPSLVEADGITIDLKNRHWAALLGLLFPGAGHFYQGRKKKAYLFAVCIVGMFAIGLFLGNGRVVYMSWKPDDYRLQFPAQVCVGLPALPAILHANATQAEDRNRGPRRSATTPPRPLTWSTFMAPPEDMTELSRWHLQSSAGFELGTLMTAVAGLLNILAVFDALSGPIAPANPNKKKEET